MWRLGVWPFEMLRANGIKFNPSLALFVIVVHNNFSKKKKKKK